MQVSSDSQTVLATCADRQVAELARRQHGVVSLAQLRAAGLGEGAIKWRVQRGRLHPLHRGVYAVGHRRVEGRGRLWAAVLAVPASAVSHWSAAWAWGLCSPRGGRIEVTTRRQSRSTASVHVHRGHKDTTTQHGLPITTVAQTLTDLAQSTTQHRLERLLERAEQHRLLDTSSLVEQFDRRGGRRLRAALDARGGAEPRVTRSELEERFLDAVAEAGLERPEVNARVAGLEVDFVWQGRRLIAETDGAATHLTLAAFEADRRRDARLLSAGWRVVRFTWRQVTDGSAVATLRELL